MANRNDVFPAALYVLAKVGESPGILTIVTREEIETPARAICWDVLRRVPGFKFGVDVADCTLRL